MFRKNEKIEILEKYQDDGDSNYEWEVAADEEHGLVEIRPSNFEYEFAPIGKVQSYMIRKAS